MVNNNNIYVNDKYSSSKGTRKSKEKLDSARKGRYIINEWIQKSCLCLWIRR